MSVAFWNERTTGIDERLFALLIERFLTHALVKGCNQHRIDHLELMRGENHVINDKLETILFFVHDNLHLMDKNGNPLKSSQVPQKGVD